MAREIKYIVVHCTAGRADQPTSEIRKGWVRKGWKNCGYHYLISADGTFEQLTDLDKIANGVAGHNKHSVHVSYKGGWDFDKKKGLDTRTPEQKHRLESILWMLKQLYPDAKILGHRDLSKDLDGDGTVEKHEWIKVCPSFDAVAEYAWITADSPAPIP